MNTRRHLLKTLGNGFGYVALAGMIGKQASPARSAENPLSAKSPHFAPRAKRVLFLCMSGGPSHIDSFDYKPSLAANHGREMFLPGSKSSYGRLMASPWNFAQHGEAGLWVSDLFPHLATQADKLCMLHGMQTKVPAHPQAFLELHTGSSQFVRPSLGAWTVYGLGTENADLPGFISLSPPSGNGGSQNFGSSFLPAAYQGTPIDLKRGQGAFADIANARWNRTTQRKQLDLLQSLHESSSAREGGDAAIEGIVASYELAFRMQTTVPNVMALDKETEATKQSYGIGQPETEVFGRQCLTARRLLEAGVRFVEVSHHGWDQHSRLKDEHSKHAKAVDQPIAALLQDLEQRGLLTDTLVIWGGEFGRTPVVQGSDGRDHNHKGFTMWMAGGGTKGGYIHGKTDEFGREAIEGKVSIHDLHATILHLLGFDHEALIYNYAGRDYRLTDVYGTLVREVLS
jgi:hypothetical protein